jgi:hypothetical protein
VGNTAFVVTFRQVDPLFAIDLADPYNPRLLGELKIPGFSEYMHPLGDGHLLTIGREGTDDGQVLGVALQIFDVTNPAQPRLAHKLDLGDGSSEAEYQHKAFTFYQNTLAIPMVRWDYSAENPFAGSTLELFHIDAAAGIAQVGSVDHTALYDGMPPEYCYYYGYGIRRGVFIDNAIYSISEAGVLASDVADPSLTLGQVNLPEHTPDDCGYY